MEPPGQLFSKHNSVSTAAVHTDNVFTVTEANIYCKSCELEPCLTAIEAFVEFQMSKRCPAYKTGSDEFDELKSVLIFRLACELDIPYWSIDGDASKETLKKLLIAERKVLDHKWNNDLVENPEFYILGLHSGTSLQLVILQGNESRKHLVKELTEASGVEELRQVSISECASKDGKRTFSTPLRDLIEHYPEFAVTALNNCLLFNKPQDPMKEGRYLKLDMKVSYDIIDEISTVHRLKGACPMKIAFQSPNFPIGPANFKIDSKAETESPTETRNHTETKFRHTLENNPLRLISRSDNSMLLNHPIVQLFVLHVWGRVKWSYYYQLIWFSLYLISLDIFILGESSYMMSNNSNHTDGVLSFPRASVFIELPGHVQCSLIITLSFCVYGLCHLIHKILFHFECAQANEMGLEMISYSCVLPYCVYIVIQGFIFDTDYDAKKHVEPVIIILGALGGCLSWITFMLYCRVLHSYGLLIEIFFSIFQRFLHCMPVGMLLVGGFVTSFAIVFRNVPLFNSVHSTFIVAAQIVFSQITTNDVLDSADGYRNLHQQNAAYLITVYVFIFGFLVMAILTFVNMLTGLATDDVQKMMQEAKVDLYHQQLKMSVDFTINYQKMTNARRSKMNKTMDLLASFFNCFSNNNKIRLAKEKKLNGIISKAVEAHISTM